MNAELYNEEMEIAPGIKVERWKEINLNLMSVVDDWRRGVYIFEMRIGARFLEPIRAIVKNTNKEISEFCGFVVMALDCLLIETLQAFYDGRLNPTQEEKRAKTKGPKGGGSKVVTSEDVFVNFLSNRDSFKKYFTKDHAKTFYDHFRCGILHQAEVKGSSRIRRVGALLKQTYDGKGLIINRELFHKKIKQEFDVYRNRLLAGGPKNEDLRKKFIAKMNHICRL